MLAECLSEEHKKPLYRVNLGMLVADMRWETTIEEIFRQAHVWDAILLIDEAEVVLAERTQESMHSLAWVAVFLRKIEYFEGILFLTTNQIHMIDPAFISRVNFGMKFPTLDSKTRLQIWEKMLGDLGDSNNADLLNLEKDTLKEWAMKPLNGRQIRNVIYSARLLADPPMTGQITKAGIKQCLADVTNFSKKTLALIVSVFHLFQVEFE
ncbi:P-loop containing nucleoside triphosphate hydrolase protein [Truncatella angustata]|uniref:P-loop containing nucleoside triphosphate hydrolase protein n=1 Tax=Truncatella angustata TaxID=152316 RepID=A0A9P8UY53_9PEZI|nr:P-loop containing nucleoside triphosphate hydrolase protein [Truncatella angustata]KAH6660285.1 P-loop containing nucleoside triphosphate hydrolase protein [Truncatella angustata]